MSIYPPYTKTFYSFFKTLFICLIFISSETYGQKDSVYFAKLAETFRGHLKSNLDSAKVLADKILIEATNSKYTKGIAIGYNYKGICNIYEGKYDSATVCLQSALINFGENSYTKGVCDVYSNMGVCYDYLGKFAEAIKNYLNALRVAEKINDQNAIARACNNLGAIYYQRNEFKTAMTYFKRSLKIRESEKDIYGIASCCLNIGACLSSLKDLNGASLYLKKSIEHAKLSGDSVLLADGYVNLAQNYSKDRDFITSIAMYKSALPIYESFNDRRSIADLNYYIADDYRFLKDFKSAHALLLKSFITSKAIRYGEGIKRSASGLVTTSSHLQKPDSVEYFLSEYSVIRDSLFSESNSKQIADMQTKYETEKKDQELKVKDLEIEKQTVESKQKLFQRNAFIAGFVLMCGMAFFIFRNYREKKKSLFEISEQKKIIEEKNKNITDSINYAQRIQEAILPPLENANSLFSESFILFIPKDVVSGDFYWYHQKNNKKLIAAVDCTGHGVPGALMSMIGNAFLNEIVNEKGIVKPAEILSELRDKITHSLKQTGEVGQTKDGMDMALLCVNDDNTRVEFSGANNPLWVCSNNGEGSVITEYKGDKQPVGYYIGKSLPFTNHVIDVKKGDTLYVFTDGFADQFGGPKGKKYKYSQLRDKLIAVQTKSMTEQKQFLLDEFAKWKGSFEQIDDVCVIGIRI